MYNFSKSLSAVFVLIPGLFIFSNILPAQPNFTIPRSSPHASVSQTIGITEINIDFHRPGVKGRTIWGGLQKYGEVWRAGANENTTISFSHDVKIEGKDLAAGKYGLHMIPGKNDWTVIF